MTDADRKIAKKRVKARRDFANTALVLVVVEIVLIAVWFVSSGGHGYFWPLWPALGFGIAIVFSALNAFGILNRDVTDGDIDAELERMRRKG